MPDNTTLNPGIGGDVARSIDRAGVKTQVVAIDLGGEAGPENLLGDGGMPITATELPLPTGAATQATLATLLAAAQAIQAAAEALNGKATAINTGAVAGTVALDAPTLAALESITASTGGLTEAQLRAAALPMSAIALPLPTGAATEAAQTTGNGTLASLLAKLIDAPATEATLALLTAAVGAHDAVAADGRSGMVVLAKRRDNDGAATVADGDLAFLIVDENQRLKVASQPASYVDVTGNITAVQAVISTPVAGGTVEGDVSRASNLMVFCTGTFAGVNCTFEGSLESSGDSNWFAIQAIRSNANTIELTTGALSAQPAYAWELSVNALSRFRVRCTARTSGTQAWRFKQGTYATEPIPGAQASATQPVSGSVTATLAAATVRAAFIAGSGIWYDDSAVALASAATFTGTSRDATVTATATAFANAATYAKEVRALAESDQSGTLWLEVSRDNTNWRRVRSVSTAAITGGGQAAELVYLPAWRYWRIGFTNGATVAKPWRVGSGARPARPRGWRRAPAGHCGRPCTAAQ